MCFQTESSPSGASTQPIAGLVFISMPPVSDDGMLVHPGTYWRIDRLSERALGKARVFRLRIGDSLRLCREDELELTE